MEPWTWSIARGFDVFKLTPSEHLSQNEIDAATLVYVDELNPQHQKRFTWPATTAVPRAYLDQLTRARAIPPQRAAALRNALNRAAELRTGRERNAGTILRELDRLATELDTSASSVAVPVDAARMRSLAGSIKAITTRLRG